MTGSPGVRIFVHPRDVRFFVHGYRSSILRMSTRGFTSRADTVNIWPGT